MKYHTPKLRERSGLGMFAAVTIVLLFVILVGFATEVYRLTGTVKNVKDQIRYAVVSAATENAFEVYGGVREGNSANVKYSGSDWQQNTLATSDVLGRLQKILVLENKPEGIVNQSNGRVNFILSNLRVNYDPVGVRSNNVQTLQFNTTFDLTVPFYFSGIIKWEYTSNFSVDAAYTPVF